MLGMAGSSNVQGEDQKKLDVLANDVFITLLRKSGQCAVLVSFRLLAESKSSHVIICRNAFKAHDCDWASTQ